MKNFKEKIKEHKEEILSIGAYVSVCGLMCVGLYFLIKKSFNNSIVLSSTNVEISDVITLSQLGNFGKMMIDTIDGLTEDTLCCAMIEYKVP